jgi:hypothetical protein
VPKSVIAAKNVQNDREAQKFLADETVDLSSDGEAEITEIAKPRRVSMMKGRDGQPSKSDQLNHVRVMFGIHLLHIIC